MQISGTGKEKEKEKKSCICTFWADRLGQSGVATLALLAMFHRQNPQHTDESI
jgi:hypothetical protein